ncbi:MAG: hypothetical protein JF603_08540 [Acidobacteria bacterium]|nr:hypothetical protein [Acidobacteriota bacterium]
MADERGPIDLAADFLVYAPVGFAIAARELLPDLAERGRAYVDGQVAVARVVGQVAVKQGQSEAGKVLSQVRDQVGGALEQLLRSWASGGEPATDAPASPTAAGPTAAPAPPTSGPGAATLAIPEYDSLAASQVLPRLNGLTAEELEAVRDYEASHRGRRTVLGKIDQLQRPA